MIPHPPKSRSLTDFIVIVFTVMVATIFVGLTIAAIVLAIFTDKNTAPFFAVITDTMTTVVAALVGYVAGRGASRTNGGD